MNHTERAKEFLEEYCESRFCKKCIHYGLCTLTYDDKFGCTHFKLKSRFVELPCEVGQKVWFVQSTNWQRTEWEVVEGKVSMLQQKVDKSWKVRISFRGSVWDITLDEIGKDYFLSREEAEKALKERVME